MVVLSATVTKRDPVLIWRVMALMTNVNGITTSTVEFLPLCNLYVLQKILLEPLEKQYSCIKDSFSNYRCEQKNPQGFLLVTNYRPVVLWVYSGGARKMQYAL